MDVEIHETFEQLGPPPCIIKLLSRPDRLEEYKNEVDIWISFECYSVMDSNYCLADKSKPTYCDGHTEQKTMATLGGHFYCQEDVEISDMETLCLNCSKFKILRSHG